MNKKKCPICDKIITGVSLGALETYYEKHMRTHKLYASQQNSELNKGGKK